MLSSWPISSLGNGLLDNKFQQSLASVAHENQILERQQERLNRERAHAVAHFPRFDVSVDGI